MGSEAPGDMSLDEERKKEWRESVREATANKETTGVARISQRAWKPGQVCEERVSSRRGRKFCRQLSKHRCSCPQLDPPAVLGDVAVIIVAPKIPTNVGVVARACATKQRHISSSAFASLCRAAASLPSFALAPAGNCFEVEDFRIVAPRTDPLGRRARKRFHAYSTAQDVNGGLLGAVCSRSFVPTSCRGSQLCSRRAGEPPCPAVACLVAGALAVLRSPHLRSPHLTFVHLAVFLPTKLFPDSLFPPRSTWSGTQRSQSAQSATAIRLAAPCMPVLALLLTTCQSQVLEWWRCLLRGDPLRTPP